jgi:transposase
MGHRFELTDAEWAVIEPLLPNKPRGVPRVDDRRVLNGIFWVLRTGAPWEDMPERYGPRTTVYNRFNRWRKAGVWARLLEHLQADIEDSLYMVDSSVVRVHQHGTGARKKGARTTRAKPSRAISKPAARVAG